MKVCLILCDSLRYDRVNEHTMPLVWALKNKGAWMSNFFADGGTTKWSMPFYLSGKKEFDEDYSFPKILSDNKIRNMIIHSNAVLVKEKYQECFQIYKDTGTDSPANRIRNILRDSEIWKVTRPLRKKIIDPTSIPYRRAENILAAAQTQLDLYSNGFYWVHLMDPHIPYSSPCLKPEEKGRATYLYEKIISKVEINESESDELQYFYDKECRYMDKEIGKFVALNPDTVFIVTSDHGEMFGETGSYSHGPWFHGMTPQLSHVPFIVFGPNVRQNHVKEYHSSIEVGTTILDLFDVEYQVGFGKSFKQEIMK